MICLCLENLLILTTLGFLPLRPRLYEYLLCICWGDASMILGLPSVQPLCEIKVSKSITSNLAFRYLSY